MLVKDYNNILNGYVNDSDVRYAVLINGKWGSGKTYYIKNYLKFELDKDKHIKVYVSLYGIEKIEDINIYIINAYLKMLLGMISNSELNIENYCRNYNRFYLTYDVKKTKYICNHIIQYLKNYNVYEIINWLMDQMKFEFVGYNFDFLKNMIDRKLKEIVAASNVLLVIDDFERSNLGFVNILGYINNLVEHYKYKVILVANEDQINACYANKDINLKIAGLLAGNFVKEDFEQNELYSMVTDKLNYDIEYYNIKEKTIGQTINFELNIDEVIIEILKNFIKSTNKREHIVEFEKFIKKI